MEQLQYTKFLDIQSPVGVQQNEKEKYSEYNSIGVDIYFPRPTGEFINALLESNKNSELLVSSVKLSNIGSLMNSFDIYDTFKHKVIISFNNGKYEIYDNIQIPTGLGLLIPKEYYVTVNPKSSNFQIGYSVVEGFIDCNYTYGMGVQIKLLNKEIILEPNQKFAQLILKESNFINNMREISQKDWEIHPEVLKRREIRTGGFGTTGKFDK